MKKRILITGVAGFVGSHVVEHILNNTDWDIIGLARLNYAGDLQRFKSMECMTSANNRLKFVYHDLKFDMSYSLHQKIGKVDYVLHLAANSHVDRSIEYPKEFFMDNVIGTVNLMEYLRSFNKDALIINFGTDEVFGAADDDYNFKEDDRYRPSNPYSGSKVGQMAVGMSYFITYGLKVISTYTMNIFGERQNPEKLVPLAIKNCLNGNPIQIHSKLGKDGTVIEVGQRHWLHARNAADALLFLLNKGVAGEHYNVVVDTEMYNDEMCKLIGDIIGKPPILEYIDFHQCRPGHDRRYALDGSKLKKLGWIPPLAFDASMRKMVEWEIKKNSW